MSKAFTLTKVPLQLNKLFDYVQSGRPSAKLFAVTAGAEGSTWHYGLTVMDALCMLRGPRFGEDLYNNWWCLCERIVKHAVSAGMLNHMSGARRDTPLMKACASGSFTMVVHLLMAGASDPHLGVITPPIRPDCFYLVALCEGFMGDGCV